MKKLGIRVSTNKAYGRGHLERCLEIRRYITKPVIWFIDDNTTFDSIPKGDMVVNEKGINYYSQLKKYIINNKINFLLIDSYNISDKKKDILCDLIPAALIVDKNCDVNADILVCPQLLFFNHLKSKISLIGAQYAPIKKDYCKINKRHNNKNNKVINILVSMGSYDSKGISIKILKAIETFFTKKNYIFLVNVIIGIESPHIKNLKLFSSKYPNINIHVNIKNMMPFYKISDLAIGAPGLSNMERLAAGLPTIIISQNKTQEYLKYELVKYGYSVGAKNTVDSISEAIIEMVSSNTKLKILSIKGMKLVDGKGAQRISQYINKELIK